MTEPQVLVGARIHKIIVFANPHLSCFQCGTRVTAYHDNKCDCSSYAELILYPCQHNCGYRILCKTWSPVDGCTCEVRNHK